MKLRGKKRYFKNLCGEINNINLNDLDLEELDYWHFHVDFEGYGKLKNKYRREFLKLELYLYERLINQLEEMKVVFQIWIVKDLDDSINDTIYVKVKEAARYSFPLKDEDIIWGIEVPYLYKDIIDSKKYNFGFVENHILIDVKQRLYYIQSKNCGISI